MQAAEPKIPGYTGYRPGQNFSELPGAVGESNEEVRRHQIPGYQGFGKGVKSENCYGSTYGRTTKKSIQGQIVKGSEHEPKDKYQTTSGSVFTNQKQHKIAADKEEA